MTTDLMKSGRLGYWSAVTLAGVGVAYVFAIAAGISRHGFTEPITGLPLLEPWQSEPPVTSR